MTERESRYFPVQCPVGHRPFLAHLPAGVVAPSLDGLRCPVCGGEGKVLPGAYYTAATRERFERVAIVLSEAQLTREQLTTVVASLDRAARDSESETDMVLSALSKVSGLDALSELVPHGASERRGFVGLVLALLVAGVSRTPPERPRTEHAPRPHAPRAEPTRDEQGLDPEARIAPSSPVLAVPIADALDAASLLEGATGHDPAEADQRAS